MVRLVNGSKASEWQWRRLLIKTLNFKQIMFYNIDVNIMSGFQRNFSQTTSVGAKSEAWKQML